MFQVIFNKISAAEMAVLPKGMQLDILMDFQLLPEDLEGLDKGNSVRFGRVKRRGQEIFRCHAGDYRIYFAKHPDGVLIHRVLHKNTLGDFLYRTNLHGAEEDKQVGDSKKFWKLIEEADSSAEKKE